MAAVASAAAHCRGCSLYKQLERLLPDTGLNSHSEERGWWEKSCRCVVSSSLHYFLGMNFICVPQQSESDQVKERTWWVQSCQLEKPSFINSSLFERRIMGDNVKGSNLLKNLLTCWVDWAERRNLKATSSCLFKVLCSYIPFISFFQKEIASMQKSMLGCETVGEVWLWSRGPLSLPSYHELFHGKVHIPSWGPLW